MTRYSRPVGLLAPAAAKSTSLLILLSARRSSIMLSTNLEPGTTPLTQLAMDRTRRYLDPVIVAQPVLVPVSASPVMYAPSYGSDLFFYEGRYYTVRDDRWYSSARLNSPWLAISIGKVPRAVVAVPVAYYRVPPGHLKQGGPRPGHCPPGQAKKGRC